ncbi:hypothetical protein K469DRAFT_700944 [Zopfia rhizophila CBS 207.26]|uniref:Gluconokinase n=1 Tax=Zopfia rhizophila CBS 207.26 TaxID=1314779 RepID=A0A6A6EEK2_9PEZI|nr:hypothetical protein K469DRAFT_700944 [Zopfia rhizophila CBS 207.26]
MLQTYEPAHSTPLHYAPASTAPLPSSIAPTVRSNAAMPEPSHHHILIVTGPAGCGKSTVAKYLADQYSFDYVEGDDVSGHYPCY